MADKKAVILVNLGTPESATPQGVKAFLKKFLMDKRVVGIPHLVWWPILNGIVLPLRCKRVAHAYQQIWMSEGSPLLVYSQKQQKALQANLGDDYLVELAMTYGEPSLNSAWQRLKEQQITDVCVLPLYPQYSSTTTASVSDSWGLLMSKEHYVPHFSFIAEHYSEPEYIQALADSVTNSGFSQEDYLLFSFHGIPEAYAERGDPYPSHCYETAKAVAEKLKLSQSQFKVSFQSRFGKQKWLEPYTDSLLRVLPRQGKKRLFVISPAFSVDCLETLEEIAQEGKQTYLSAGGESFHYIPALNDSSGYIAALANIVRKSLK